MKHYDITYAAKTVNYKGFGRGSKKMPPRNEEHVDRIVDLYQAAIRQEEITLKGANVEKARDGYYLKFENAPDYSFALGNLDNSKIGHIVSVKEEKNEEGKLVTSAILYLKKNKKDWLTDKAEEYKHKELHEGQKNRPNAELIETIENVSAVGMASLWMGKGELPGKKMEWVELWFRSSNPAQALQQLQKLGIVHKEQTLTFPERVVVLAYVNKTELERVFFSSDSLVRISEVPTLAGFIADEQGLEQQDWLEMIMGQYSYDRIENNRFFCLLDSGVVKDHPMLLPVLANEDRYVVNSQWGVNDVMNHGTKMAGVVAYGDLTDVLGHGPVMEPRSRLCSVKVLRNEGKSQKEFWGDYTKQAVALAEIHHGNNVNGYCMAVSEINGYTCGVPTSWSGALDQICNDDDGMRRLFIQCAGNIDRDTDFMQYPESNKTLGVVNPGQAWNALTVGAYTEKHIAKDDKGQQLNLVALPGGLSPYSTTSAMWGTQAPIKPEVVMEGGNRTTDGKITARHRDLELLTTGTRHQAYKPFDLLNATSAATAMAAHYAAVVSVENSNYWPETVRGLFVHTAEWTEQMKTDFPDKDERLRACGYGVPNLEKMLESKRNGVTFIAQKTIQPYKKENNRPKYNQMHIYKLPWPKEALLALGDKEVKLTITLSYYIEPGPTDNFSSSFKKYAYASSGLRFELSTDRDTRKSFQNRLLKEYNEDEMKIPNDTRRWGLGVQNRTKGSIHKDWIECMAADLARCDMIAVFPVSGWWYKRTGLKKVESEMRYSLIVSLETGEEQVDFTTEIDAKIPVAQKIEVRY